MASRFTSRLTAIPNGKDDVVMTKPAGRRASGSESTVQTLDRGLTVLDLLATALHPMTLDDLARCMGLHRSVVYRLLRTLQMHHLVARAPGGYVLGTRTFALSRTALPIVQQAAKPEVSRLAFNVGLSAFLVVSDGAEAVTLISVEVESIRLRQMYAPGVRHPLILGAPGLAILAGRPARQDERPEVTRGRKEGYVATFGEVIPTQGTVAAPIYAGTAEAMGAVSITFGTERPGSKEVHAVVESARLISGRLSRAVFRGAVVPDLAEDEFAGSAEPGTYPERLPPHPFDRAMSDKPVNPTHKG